MTNAEAEKRSVAAMKAAYMRHPDPSECTSWELRELFEDAVKVEFRQMSESEFVRKFKLDTPRKD